MGTRKVKVVRCVRNLKDVLMLNHDWHMAGHAAQREQLESDLNSGKLAHAYLFYGPKEVGKFTLAKAFATILQCPEGMHDPENPTYVQIQKGCHLDTITLEDDGSSIKIDAVQKLIQKLSQTSQSNYKVILIEDIERMTIPAANALLKTLEEPSEDTVFLMTTNNVTEILDTIVSRSRLIKFAAVSNTELESFLAEKQITVDSETKRLAEIFSFGSIGRFFRLVEDSEALREQEAMYKNLISMLEGSLVAERFKFVEGLAKEKPQVKKMLELLIHILRSMVLAKSGFSTHLKDFPTLLDRFELEDIVLLLEKAEKARQDVDRNINTRLLLEDFFLAVP